MTIVEVTEPPGAEAPLHVHYRDDEAFWILEGNVTFEVGDETIEASEGDYCGTPDEDLVPCGYVSTGQRGPLGAHWIRRGVCR